MLVSIGIPAYNEEKNIGNILYALQSQKTVEVKIDQIIVVSSGSTDKTDEIVEGFARHDSRIHLIKQPDRRGKASAINEFLKVARNDILVLESADTIPTDDAVEKLCSVFTDSQVGMAGAHPIPINTGDGLAVYASRLLWKIHHNIALKSPKCGEMIAFRKVFDSIPEDTAVDEAWIEYEILKRNYKIVYVPEAIVYNKGAETVEDYIKQRRRIACGHIELTKRTKYKVSTQNLGVLFKATLEAFPLHNPSEWIYFLGAIVLEGLGRVLGYYDYLRGKKHVIWDVAKSTKMINYEIYASTSR